VHTPAKQKTVQGSGCAIDVGLLLLSSDNSMIIYILASVLMVD